jgi:hypothetical protein
VNRVVRGLAPLGAQRISRDSSSKPTIHAVSAARAKCNLAGGTTAALVAYLDFAPRNRELAAALARSFVRTLAPETFREVDCSELQDTFFSWLAPKVEPAGQRARSRKHFRTQSAADLRLLGLLDQYRASGALATGTCPLFRAAYSELA